MVITLDKLLIIENWEKAANCCCSEWCLFCSATWVDTG